MRLHRVVISLFVLLALVLTAPPILAYQTASGYAITDFATGFVPNGSGGGPIGLAFDSSNNLLVMDVGDGYLYKFGAAGGVASAATRVNTSAIPGEPLGITFDKSGRLYVASRAGTVAEIDPTTGAILRTVVSGISCAAGLATDPLSGDLFLTSFCLSDVYRISNFANGPGTLTVYSSPGTNDGITFTPDGTLYVAANSQVARIAGTNTANPGAFTYLASIPTLDGVAVAASSDPSKPPFLFANRNDGIITKVDLITIPPTQTNIVTGGSRGDFVAVGPDGCLYATQSTSVEKVTNADGTCSLAPISAVPQIQLRSSTPPSTSPPVGTPQTFTATLTNVVPPSGVGMTFTVTGANPQSTTVVTDGGGQASFTYTGSAPGTDTIIASTTAGGVAVKSNPWTTIWANPVAPPAAPTITDLVEGGYVSGGTFHLTGHAVPHAHITCHHKNSATDVWQVDAGDDGSWAVNITLGGDGADILYVDETSGSLTSHLIGGGGEGFRILVDDSDARPDFRITGTGGGVQDIYLGDVSVAIAATDGGVNGIDKIVYRVDGDDTADWTTISVSSCGCLPDSNAIRFHKIGRRTVSYYVIDKQGYRGPIRTRVIHNKAQMAITAVMATPGVFSTAILKGQVGSAIGYTLSEQGSITVRIHDASGAIIRTLVNGGNRPGGLITGDGWDGKNDGGVLVANCGCHATVAGVDQYGFPAIGGGVDVLVDSIPPTIAITGVTENGSATDSATPTIAIVDPAGPDGTSSGIDPGQTGATLDGQPFIGGTSVTKAGAHTLIAKAGDKAGNMATPQTIHFAVRHMTTTTITGGTPNAAGLLLPVGVDGKMQLGAMLKDQSTTPLAGESMTLTVGGASCTATTDASGRATCGVTPTALGPQTLGARFAGDPSYLPSQDSKATLLFANAASGQFVLGDTTVAAATVGQTDVTFWGAQWAKNNSMSGGAGPNAFKGFDNSAPSLACGATWTTDPGDSSKPPDSIPAYMAVIVSSHVDKSDSAISGDIVKIVIVKTDAGYAGNPGHAGTGVIIATYCG